MLLRQRGVHFRRDATSTVLQINCPHVIFPKKSPDFPEKFLVAYLEHLFSSSENIPESDLGWCREFISSLTNWRNAIQTSRKSALARVARSIQSPVENI